MGGPIYSSDPFFGLTTDFPTFDVPTIQTSGPGGLLFDMSGNVIPSVPAGGAYTSDTASNAVWWLVAGGFAILLLLLSAKR